MFQCPQETIVKIKKNLYVNAVKICQVQLKHFDYIISAAILVS